MQKVPPWTLVLGGAGSVQFGAAVATTLFDELGPAAIALLRLLLGSIVLLAVFRPAVRGKTRADLRLAALFGLVLGAMNTLFYEALDRVPLGPAVTIEFVGPLAVAILGSRRRTDVGFALLAGAGIALLALGGGTDTDDGRHLDLLGLLLVLGAAACWAGYILLGKRLGQAFPGGQGLAVASVIALLVPLGPGLAQGGGDLVEPRYLLLGLVVAVMSSVIPYSLELEALRRMPANVFGVLLSLDPALAALAGFLVLGQSLGVTSLLAIGCVIAASVGVTLNADREHVPVDA